MSADIPATPLGELLHNPGNLRDFGIPWLGLADPPIDERGFCIFVDDFHGLRALSRDLYNKWSRDGLKTVEQIISKYAPSGDDNDTSAYIADVCGNLGIKPDSPLDLSIAPNLGALARAIIRHEQGRCIYSVSALAAAVAAALG